MAERALKDPALQEYYDALFEMFGTPGWRMLMEDADRMHQTHDSLAGLDTAEQLWHRKGEVRMIEWLLSRREACEHAYQSLLEEQEGGEQDSPTGGRAKVVE